MHLFNAFRLHEILADWYWIVLSVSVPWSKHSREDSVTYTEQMPPFTQSTQWERLAELNQNQLLQESAFALPRAKKNTTKNCASCIVHILHQMQILAFSPPNYAVCIACQDFFFRWFNLSAEKKWNQQMHQIGANNPLPHSDHPQTVLPRSLVLNSFAFVK